MDKSNPFQMANNSPILAKKMPKYQKVHESLEKQQIPTINKSRIKDSIDNFIDSYQS